MTGGNLRSEVSLALLRRAHVVEQQRQYIFGGLAFAYQLHRRDAEAFLVDLTAQAHRSRIRTSDIRMMCPGRNKKVGARSPAWPRSRCRVDVHGSDQRNVGQVRAAAERIVQHRYVTWQKFHPLDSSVD